MDPSNWPRGGFGPEQKQFHNTHYANLSELYMAFVKFFIEMMIEENRKNEINAQIASNITYSTYNPLSTSLEPIRKDGRWCMELYDDSKKKGDLFIIDNIIFKYKSKKILAATLAVLNKYDINSLNDYQYCVYTLMNGLLYGIPIGNTITQNNPGFSMPVEYGKQDFWDNIVPVFDQFWTMITPLIQEKMELPLVEY